MSTTPILEIKGSNPSRSRDKFFWQKFCYSLWDFLPRNACALQGTVWFNFFSILSKFIGTPCIFSCFSLPILCPALIYHHMFPSHVITSWYYTDIITYSFLKTFSTLLGRITPIVKMCCTQLPLQQKVRWVTKKTFLNFSALVGFSGLISLCVKNKNLMYEFFFVIVYN